MALPAFAKRLINFNAAGPASGTDVIYTDQGSGERAMTATQLATFVTASAILQNLLQWSYASSYQLVSVTRDTNGAIVSASIVWPDGGTGTFTTDTASIIFLGAIDAWHATYVNGSTTHTVHQSLVTRDANGAVIAQPAITIS